MVPKKLTRAVPEASIFRLPVAHSRAMSSASSVLSTVAGMGTFTNIKCLDTLFAAISKEPMDSENGTWLGGFSPKVPFISRPAREIGYTFALLISNVTFPKNRYVLFAVGRKC